MRFAAYSRTGSYVGDVPTVLSAVRTRNVDGTDTVEMAYSGIDLRKDDRVVIKMRDAWREYAVMSVSRTRGDNLEAAVAVMRNSVCELSRKYVVEREGRGYTAAAALEKAIEGTRWSQGTVDATGTSNVSFYHQSALKSIEDICASYGCELDATVEVSGASVTRRLVHLRGRIGGPGGRRFEYSRDLMSVRRTVMADDVVTRLYGWGKGVQKADESGNPTGGFSRKVSFADINGGKAYVEDAEATERFGVPGADGRMRPAEGDYDNGDVEDPAELLRLTREELKRRSEPRVSYECDVATLQRAGEGPKGVECGDTVQIVDTAFEPPLRLEGRVLEVSEDLVGDLSESKVTLGNVVETLTRANKRAETAVQRLTGSSGAWDSAASLGQSYLEGVIEGLNAALNEVGGYVYHEPGEGLFVYDRPKDKSPTMCIHLGGGYFRIADGRGPDGEWAFRTAGTGHGLVADELVTGTITGGSNTWNLGTGDLRFRQGSIVMDGPSGTQVRISASEGFKVYQDGSFIGGIEVVGGKAHLRAARAGSSQSLYITTGTTQQGNPGASFVNSHGNYLDVEALRASADPSGKTTGAGMACFNEPFLHVSDFYNHLWLHPPKIKDTYMEQPPEQLYMGSSGSQDGTARHAKFQLGPDRGLFMNDDQTILKHDSTHWIRIDTSGVQCRCGKNGFGWLDGKFVDNLVWS